MNSIKKENIYFAVINGAKEVMENRLYLNKINVFPVADGDTGSNLFSTMQSIITHSELKHTLKHTLESVADSAIEGARGNSGLIFAQYFHGLSQAVTEKNDITTEEFVLASKKGVMYAYDAIENPVEGTMLTTMKVFHESLSNIICEGLSFYETLDKAYKNVEKAVLKTTDQLFVLKKSSVVDSGAKGFAYFIKGFVSGIKGQFKARIVEDHHEVIPQIDHIHEEINFKYCTEALIKCDNFDAKLLKDSLSHIGDSLIVAGGKTKARIHIHTDEPAKVFEILSRNHKILSHKVDDMVLQESIVNNRLYKHVIVTDSIADLPQDFINDEQIYLIHLKLLLNDESYIDKLTITNNKLFDLSKAKKIHPTSSQPSVESVRKVYNYLLDYYDSILVVSVSKSLSGTYSVLKKASEGNEDKITVVDSKQNSVAQGLLVWKAAQALKNNVNFEQVKEHLYKDIKKSKILVKIKTLDNMIASGRLSVKAGFIAKKIALKPIISLDSEGKGCIESIAFSDKSSFKKILKHLKKIHGEKTILHYAITYVDDYEAGKVFADTIQEALQLDYAYITESSSIIAVGAGKGALAVSYITK